MVFFSKILRQSSSGERQSGSAVKAAYYDPYVCLHVRWCPLVAEVMTTAAKEEVRPNRMKTVRGRRFGWTVG